MSNQNLAYEQIKGIVMPRTNLSNGLLNNTYWGAVEAQNSNYAHANLNDATFHNSTFKGSRFQKTNLIDAGFEEVVISRSHFQGANLQGMTTKKNRYDTYKNH